MRQEVSFQSLFAVAKPQKWVGLKSGRVGEGISKGLSESLGYRRGRKIAGCKKQVRDNFQA